MKRIIFLLLLVACFSCTSENNVELTITKGVRYEIITIDSCEYIFGTDKFAYNGGYFLSHKGNCKNPIHYK